MADDEKISRLFQDAKRADEARVPGFERVLTRTRTARPRPRGAVLAAVALAALVIVDAFGILRVRAQHREAELTALEKTPAILEWQSPTGFLLETPGHELRDSLPQLGSTQTVSAAQPQGEKQ